MKARYFTLITLALVLGVAVFVFVRTGGIIIGQGAGGRNIPLRTADISGHVRSQVPVPANLNLQVAVRADPFIMGAYSAVPCRKIGPTTYEYGKATVPIEATRVKESFTRYSVPALHFVYDRPHPLRVRSWRARRLTVTLRCPPGWEAVPPQQRVPAANGNVDFELRPLPGTAP